jgi:hypothetical protein
MAQESVSPEAPSDDTGKRMNDVTKLPIYTTPELEIATELRVMRSIVDEGYIARVAGFKLKDCPRFRLRIWSAWWCSGWRQRRNEERIGK